MRLFNKIRRALRRVTFWILAASLTLAAIFITVLIYKWATSEPSPPPLANCQIQQAVTLAQDTTEIHAYRCQRGRSNKWHGFEVWLYEPPRNHWLRIATAEGNQCLTIDLRNLGGLIISYSHSRGDIYVPKSSVIYTDKNGRPNALSVLTQRTEGCVLP
jgi:hypothetical protein